jgi:anti-sigma regulatory factor (Ser/Thr protein kinase)
VNISDRRKSRNACLDLVDDAVPPLHDVRRWVELVLRGQPQHCVRDAVLLVNELVSNVYDHGRPPRRVRMSLVPSRSVIRVEVDDGAPGRVPVLGVSRLGAHRGRGLLLVDRVSTGWSVRTFPGGKTVWAEIPCPVARQPAAARTALDSES